MNNLLWRTITGALFVVVIIGAIILGHLVFSLLFLAVVAGAMTEFYKHLNKRGDIDIDAVSGIAAGVVLYASAALVSLEYLSKVVLLINLVLPLLLFIREIYRKTRSPFRNVAGELLGIIYIAVPFSVLNFFFNPGFSANEYHPDLLMGFFFILWTYDTFALVTGLLFGRHKFFERLSPNKTWEGTLGGVVFGLVTAWIVSVFFHEFTRTEWFVLAFITMIFGTFGDLVESMFKRSFDIKDSGNLLPGHGGLLDRFDGMLLAAPAVFVYMVLIH